MDGKGDARKGVPQCRFSETITGVRNSNKEQFNTYDHRLVRTGHPVRSAILKHQIGRSVVEWVTISESLLLYVFFFSFLTPAVVELWWRLLWSPN